MDAADTSLDDCVGTTSRRDTVLLVISSSHEQPPFFHLPYVQEPFIPNVEHVILGTPGQSHGEMDPGQLQFPAEKLCHLQDRLVNLHRAAWGKCIIAPKTFSFPYCEGICLAINSECCQSNFECYKSEMPTYAWLFQVCGPTRVRLFSLMVQDDEHEISVYHLNTSVIEKCGCL
ncbi:growth/differentiation factor 3 [Orycteropus afer afer]|uniref:Growth/differentiation factor 3 n=1 Tax=Orycteropus afer afer TaxID=1230840 RepID=A0AC54ZAM1_ORYAF|nr:growth/differentiation factor 3 [Orycteropus afer afer]